MQAEVGAWVDEQFLPGDTLERRGLVLGAESGEVQQAIVKAQQNVQGGPDRWMPEVEIEAGDAFIALCGIAHRGGFDLAAVAERRWATVSQRVYKGTGT
jgi:NTP pyrophosphatase (non-canonical NTP hydrolase)